MQTIGACRASGVNRTYTADVRECAWGGKGEIGKKPGGVVLSHVARCFSLAGTTAGPGPGANHNKSQGFFTPVPSSLQSDEVKSRRRSNFP